MLLYCAWKVTDSRITRSAQMSKKNGPFTTLAAGSALACPAAFATVLTALPGLRHSGME